MRSIKNGGSLEKLVKPVAVEQLVFRVNPGMVDAWMELDHEIWTKGLAEWPGFAGKEVWVSRDVPGEVIAVIYWNDYDLWQAIDGEWLERTDNYFLDRFGRENVEFVAGLHEKNQFFKVFEYQKGDN